ncbi:MAG: C40 family peptidase [Eubacterium sp.]|nr:C40 family peptidase [Eubacterium sp.]
MIRELSKKIACLAFTTVLAMTSMAPASAAELDTEIPSAGAAEAIGNYVASNGSDSGISGMLPSEASVAVKTTNKSAANSNDKFANIAIAKVKGGKDDYVRVRKSASTKSKVEGKIYNNCGATLLKTTSNGWYKIKSGNCVGYVKGEFLVTGAAAKAEAFDNGYVIATIKDTGIHVREKANTGSDVVTNVYNEENYVIKKVSDDGKWAKIKIGDGVNGWVSTDYVKTDVDMETGVTIAEEKAAIKAEQERKAAEAAERRAKARAKAQSEDDSSASSNSGSSSSSSSSSSSYSDSSEGSGTGAKIVAYAKRFLGNPYVYGGSSLTGGTDCSGFTMSVYAHFGYSLNRTSYAQANNGRAVSMGSLKKGDLLFYDYGGGISHVAIYIGGGSIIHASTEETGIIISGMGSPCCARRII